jgi:hypothetical protein
MAWDDERAIAEYERSHWGDRGNERIDISDAPNPSHGTFAFLGWLWDVTYMARKSPDSRAALYEHKFEGKRPALVYNDSGLVIARAGSLYRVKQAGITG